MKRVIIGCVSALLSLSSFLFAEQAQQPTATQGAGTLVYTNSDKHYSVTYPEAWKQTDVPNLDFVLFIPSKEQKKEAYATMNVVSETVGQDITLNLFYSDSISNLSKELKDVHVEQSGDAALNGTKAKWILYIHTARNIKFRVLQFYLYADGIVYLLTFSSTTDTFDQYRKEFETVANTFKITPS